LFKIQDSRAFERSPQKGKQNILGIAESFYTLRKRARELRLPEKPMNAPIAMSMMI
jgi:hypothetical protein